MHDSADRQPDPLARPGVVIVGTDGSPTAHHAVEVAARMASASDDDLLIVTSYRPRHRSRFAAGLPERWRGDPGPESAEVLRHAIGVARGGATSDALRVLGRSEPGDPVDVLLRIADETSARMVVIGNLGMRGWSRRRSIPDRLTHRATREVLLVDTWGWARRGGMPTAAIAVAGPF